MMKFLEKEENSLSRINDNIKHIYTKIEEAAIKVGREPEEVTLIAVSKTYSAEQ